MEAVEAGEVGPGTSPSGSGRWGRVVVAAAVVVLVLVAAAWVLVFRGDPEPTPEDALSDARAAVDAAAGVRFSVRVERTLPGGVTSRSVEQGEWAEGTWHVIIERDAGAAETVIGPDGTAFTRSGASIGSDTPWDVVDDTLDMDFLDLIAGRASGPLAGTTPRVLRLTWCRSTWPRSCTWPAATPTPHGRGCLAPMSTWAM